MQENAVCWLLGGCAAVTVWGWREQGARFPLNIGIGVCTVRKTD